MTERSESERAELEALPDDAADDLLQEVRDQIDEGLDECLPSADIIGNVSLAINTALRRLAAQDQKPVAWRWRVVGDSSWTMTKTKPEVKVLSSARFEVEIEPLFAAPPPAACWDEAIEACKQARPDDFGPVQSKQPKVNIREFVEALRRNAPPDSGAGKSAPPAVLTYTNYRGETSVRSIVPKSVRYGSTEWHPEPQWLLLAYDTEKNADREFALKDFGMPDHGGADAWVVWRSISEDTRWIDGRDVVLLANDMEVQARYCPGEWCDETPSSPREYSGAVWSCFDDQFQLEIEECSEDPSEWCHDGATHWRPISALSKPAPVAANTSAEARLREAHIEVLRGLVDVCAHPVNGTGPDKTTGPHLINLLDVIERTPSMPIDKIARWTGFIQGVLCARGAISVDAERDRTRPIFSPDPHAGECDKQGPVPSGYGEYTPITVGGSTSDRTADVTETEIAVVLANARRDARGYDHLTQEEAEEAHLWPDGSESKTQARAILGAFTVGRR